MSDDATRLLERADAIEAEALAGKWLVGRTTHAPHYDDCLTCEPVRIAAALAARLRVAEAENARLREVIDNAAISWLALEPGVEWEGDLAAAMSAACGEIVRLRSANARLREDAARLEDALRTIARCEGRFSRDPLTHASNTIEDMARVATEALVARASEARDA